MTTNETQIKTVSADAASPGMASTTAPTIDAHHHLWDPVRRSYPWLADERFAPIRHRYDITDLRATGAQRTVLVQTIPDVAETAEFLVVADVHRDVIMGVVGWVDLTSRTVESLHKLLTGPGGDLLVAIRHQAQDESDPDWLLRADVRRGVRAVTAFGLAYDLLVLPHQLPAAARLAREHPDARFVLDHAGKPPVRSGEVEPWATTLRELALLPNVACKLSGLVTEADWETWSVAQLQPYADVVLGAFGAKRVLFGSDWPVCELAATYSEVDELAHDLCAGLSDDERAAVFGGTATSWYLL